MTLSAQVHRLRRAAIAVLALGVAASTLTDAGQAAEVRAATTAAGEAVVELSGIIAPGDDAKVAQAVDATPRPAALSLSSLGGNVQAALAIGTLVRHRGLKTLVPARAICASACGLVWLAGTPRAMGEEAHVGLHAAYLRKNGVAVETGAANALIGAYLDRLGFDDKAIVYLTGAAPDAMTWILAADRQRFGIAFEAAGSPSLAAAAPPRDEHFLSKPMAMAGAIAATASEVVDRLLGRSPTPGATPR